MAPYLHLIRFNKPIGVWLLMFPCWWGLSLASADLPNLKFLILFALGAFLMRGAGCIYNDLVDQDIDWQVERTACRPLAKGTITRQQAIWILMAMLSFAFIILLQFSWFVVGLGIISLILVAIYPWMKRITYWPQLFLGLAFNWGALMGWATVKESLDVSAILLYTAGISWTLGYDTIYAHQDKDDDLRIGVKSSALALGKHTHLFLSTMYCIMLLMLGITGILMHLGPLFFVGLATVSVMLFWQVYTLNIDDGENCWKRFRSNAEIGLVVFSSIVIGKIFN